MKIGMILDAEYPDDARITNQCEELTKYNHEVHLFCLSYKKSFVNNELINKINTSITIPIKISIKNSNFITSDKLENILNQSDFVYEYEIEKISSEDIIYKITYNNNPEKFLNTLKVNDININSSSNIWNIE